jgi:hypothetical protein
MDPGSLAIGSMVAGAAGSITQGIGQAYQGAANAAMYQYKAGVALINKQVNETNANWALETGDIKSEEAGLKAGQEIGQTKVQQGASGLDVNSGTNQAVRETQQSVSKFDQGIIQWDAAKTAYGFEEKAMTDTAEANLDVMAASSAKTGGTIAEIGSFLSGGSSVASKWYQGTQQGVFGSSS